MLCLSPDPRGPAGAACNLRVLVENCIGNLLLHHRIATQPNTRDVAARDAAPVESSEYPYARLGSLDDSPVLPEATAYVYQYLI